jgi:2'-5' RNA ligase
LISQQLKEIASRHPPWTIWLMGFGAFPSVRRPGVLWVGVAEDAGRAALITLAKEIDAAMAPIGFPPEPRPFHPHLTLARVRAPRHLPPVAEWLEHHRADRLAVVDIQQVALMKSERGTGGSVYTAISYCDLSAKRL